MGNEVLMNANPNKVLYGICFQVKDYIDVVSQEKIRAINLFYIERLYKISYNRLHPKTAPQSLSFGAAKRSSAS